MKLRWPKIGRSNRVLPTEHQEAVALMDWVALVVNGTHPELRWLYHVPNGGFRSARPAAMLKAEGAKAGVSDYQLPVARGGYFGLAMELKAEDGRLSPSQSEFLQFASEQGYLAVVAWNALEAVEILKAYLAYPPTLSIAPQLHYLREGYATGVIRTLADAVGFAPTIEQRATSAGDAPESGESFAAGAALGGCVLQAVRQPLSAEKKGAA